VIGFTFLSYFGRARIRGGEMPPVAKTDVSDEQFVIDLMDAAKTHKEWLGIVRFGLVPLLRNQRLFAEVIGREAERMAKRGTGGNVMPSDFIHEILSELNLKLEVATAQP
jgi:hypothetical protein